MKLTRCVQRFFQHEGFDWKGDSTGSKLTSVTNFLLLIMIVLMIL